MNRYLVSLFAGVALAGCSTSIARADSTLFTHCAAEWSAKAVGETMCGVALRNGYPATGPGTDRSCARAYNLGSAYFTWLSPTRNVSSAVLCATFSTQGPEIFPEW